MPSYKPPLDNIRFVLNDVLNVGQLSKEIPAYKDVDWETISSLLSEVGKFFREVTFPLNQSADKEGVSYDPNTKSVTMPQSTKDAYKAYVDMGLQGLTGAPEDGGMGMPEYLSVALGEMMSTNIAFALIPGRTDEAYREIKAFGSKELKEIYLKKLLSGKWSATRCLTEPSGGSHFYSLTTKAVAQEDGSYKITGNKIFITMADHDITENIVHLVLARLPGTSPGIKGMGLFLVPKFIPDENGNPGQRNEAWCTGLEEKMGLHASPTGSISFDGAKGWLIGELYQNKEAVLTVINGARMNVGVQGLSLAELAYQNIANYANERVQGKPLLQAADPEAESVPIIEHANMRKYLLDMKAQIEASRALALDTAVTIDLAAKHPEKTVRENAVAYAALLAPVIKAGFTDMGVEVSTRALQLHGGIGYITEMGVHQYVQDSIATGIYGGPSDVQSMDFIFRKIVDSKNPKNRIDLFIKPLGQEINSAKKNPKLSAYAETLEKSMKIFQQTMQGLLEASTSGKREDVLVHARDFMNMFYKLAMGRMWLKMVSAAQEKLDQGVDGELAKFYQDKLELGEYYMKRVMSPEIKKLEMRIEATAATAIAVKSTADQFKPEKETGVGMQQNSSDKRGYTFNM